MKIKTGDTVVVIAGKDKGVKGEVIKSIPKENKVIVKGVNIQTRHTKPRGTENPERLIKSKRPIHVSNVLYYDSKSNKGSRIGYKIENGKKQRYLKTTGEIIK